jgi:hypothetical protein
MKKPIKPINFLVAKKVSIEWWSLQKINDFVTEKGLNPKKVWIEKEPYFEYNETYYEVFLKWDEKKYSEAEFAEMLKVYKKDSAEYNKWLKTNGHIVQAKEKLKVKLAKIEGSLKKTKEELAKLENG